MRAPGAGATPRIARVAGVPAIVCEHLGAGPLVLFLHGIGGNRGNWRTQIDACAAAGFQAVAWDARGYGDSEDYPGPLDFADFAHDLARTLDHFKAPRAHVVGLSLGGRIALDFYERYPTRVSKLVLCSTFPGFGESFTPAERDAFVARRRDPLLAGAEPCDIAPSMARHLLGPGAGERQYQDLVASLSALHKEAYIKTVEATAWYDRVAVLPRIAVPSLLLYGSADRLTPPAIGARMAASLPDARMQVIDGAGHVLNIEQPDEFNRLLLAFLREDGD